jgi:hypothetical protein
MEQVNLITIEDIKKIRSISNVINSDKDIMPFVYEAQDVEIKRILGELLYTDLIVTYDGEGLGNSTPAKYLELLNGKQYTYNSNTYLFNGLKQIIAYYSYYSFLKQWGVHITNAGLQVKTGDMSLPVEDATRGRMLADVKSKLSSFVDDLNKFLIRNKDTYPLYYKYCEVSEYLERGSVTIINASTKEDALWG